MNKSLRTRDNGTNAGGLYQRFLLKKIKLDTAVEYVPFVRPSKKVNDTLNAGNICVYT